MDTSSVDKRVFGRVKPHIYAFLTQSVPHYLKVGDTYRTVEVRLHEWGQKFDNLLEVFRADASVSDEVFFRDYSVHQYLEESAGRIRLTKEALYKINPNAPFSNEFFLEATPADVKLAMESIHNDFKNQEGLYHFYKFEDSRIPQDPHYSRNETDTIPRKEQSDTVARFIRALEAGHRNLLMFAVMRFGKTFTSLLCAKAMEAQFVVVICGKTQVTEEWKQNVEKHKNFEGYSYYTCKNLNRNPTLISDAKASGEKIVLFLTLQDLAGKNIKKRHQELFKSDIDLLIVDETHFGARAPEYGKVLDDTYGYTPAQVAKEFDNEDVGDLEPYVKSLNARVKLHLSGTPYRILLRNEFAEEEIIAKYQLNDLIAAKELWDEEHLDKTDKNEWENPYYGIPEMIRFAFNPSKSARRLLQDLRKEGKTSSLSALFAPQSFKKDNKTFKHQRFKHEKEIVDLLRVIDGKEEDEELFSFLNYDKFKEGKMLRHIIMVLPFRASCDAMKALIKARKEEFNNLNEYEVLNISGFDCPRELNDARRVKTAIETAEREGRKTITLTVNRMLTGSTVKEWDSIIFFRDSSSAQEYDQASFRIQNPYLKPMVSEKAKESEREIIFNMKPQTVLIDFDMERMFRFQVQKSMIRSLLENKNGNAVLEEMLTEDLKIAPIITVNKSKMHEVTATNVLDEVMAYSSNRSVSDEAAEIPVDFSLMENPQIKAEIDRQSLFKSKEGLALEPHKGKKTDDFKPGTEGPEGSESQESKAPSTHNKQTELSDEEKFRRQFLTYYTRVLFFAFLSKSKITNLDELIASLEENEENKRIASNLGIHSDVLNAIRKGINGNALHVWDFKIRFLDRLSSDDSLTPLERAKAAMNKFTRLSVAEIVTPQWVAKDMVNLLPDEVDSGDWRFLDIAAKQGEFALALYDKFGDHAKNNIWSIPTSGAAYEFTRKVYEILGMPVENIFSNFTSYDLISPNNQEIIQMLKEMQFGVVIGNPPYHENDGGAGVSAKPLYNRFVDFSKTIQYKLLSIIMPSRWMAGGKSTRESNLNDFRDSMLSDSHIMNLHDYRNPQDLFPDTNNRGGICYFLRDLHYNKNCVEVTTHYSQDKSSTCKRPLKIDGTDLFIRDEIAFSILSKVGALNEEFDSFRKIVSSRKPFGIESKIIFSDEFNFDSRKFTQPIKCLVKGQKSGYIDGSIKLKNANLINKWKVFTPRANNIGTELNDDNLNAIIGYPGTVCTEAYIIVGATIANNESECLAIANYMKTRLARFLHSLAKASHDATAKTYRFVPMQDFSENSDIDWSSPIEEIDEQLYKKYGLDAAEIAFIESMIKPMN